MSADPSRPLAPSLVDAIARARAAWPEVSVPDDVFASYLLARAGEELGGIHVADLDLSCGCARGDASAISAFDRVFMAPIGGVVERSGAPAHVGAEVAQTLRDRLLVADGSRSPRIAEYAGRGSLAGWLRVAAVREAGKVRRHERVHADLTPDRAPPPPTPEQEALVAQYGALFEAAFRDAFCALAAEDRVILRLHFAEGLNLDHLAVALAFSRATAGRRLLAARGRLREGTMRLMAESIHGSPEEVESVLAAMQSRLDLSMGALVTAA